MYWPRLAHGQEERGGAMDSGLERSVPKEVTVSLSKVQEESREGERGTESV